jgi:hypothetical protein
VVLGLLRVERVDFGSPWLAVYGVGILLVMAGPLWLATRLARALKLERVLTLHEDGLRWFEGEAIVCHLRWEETERFELTAEELIVVHEGGELKLPVGFDDVTPQEVVRNLEGMRRRKLLGIKVAPNVTDRQ